MKENQLMQLVISPKDIDLVTAATSNRDGFLGCIVSHDAPNVDIIILKNALMASGGYKITKVEETFFTDNGLIPDWDFTTDMPYEKWEKISKENVI